MRKVRILITGVDGFIGSSFYRFLLNRTIKGKVYAISRHRSKKNNFFICDLTQSKKVHALVKLIRPDMLFHFAGGRKTKPFDLFMSNYMTTKNILHALDQLKLQNCRVIIPGTAAEYGPIPRGIKLIRENFSPQPASWYGLVKFMQTSLGLFYARRGLNVVIARLFNILGKGTPLSLVIGKFCRDIAAIEQGRQKPVLHTKNLSGRRDFIDIDDACRGLWQVALKGKAGEIYHICSGRSYLIRDLLKQLIAISSDPHIKVIEEKKQASQSYDAIGSLRKSLRELGYKPRIDIKKSLYNTLASYR